MYWNVPDYISAAYAAEDKATLDARIVSAKDVLDAIMATPDKAIPNQIMSQATCVGVIPSVKKGAFLVGSRIRTGCGYLPYRPRLERSGLHQDCRRQLWLSKLAARRPTWCWLP